MGGAGNKGIVILEGEADCMIHVVEGMKCWDVCAVDTLIKSRFGVTSNKNREAIKYEDKTEDFTMHNGIIMARSMGLYELMFHRLESYFKTLNVVKDGN